jgi:SAM-dependent methyltransferase
MENLGFPGNHFDAVICVFGIFFIPDMDKQVRELWRMVKPGGKLAITTWGPRFLAPAYENWKEEIKKERPDLYCAYNPWDRITDVKSLTKLMRDGGTSNIEVIEEEGKQPLMNAEDWWIIALGTGLRWTIDQLSPDSRERVKRANLLWLTEKDVDAVETNVIYAVATKDWN